MIDKEIHFKTIGGHCYDIIEKQLEQNLKIPQRYPRLYRTRRKLYALRERRQNQN